MSDGGGDKVLIAERQSSLPAGSFASRGSLAPVAKILSRVLGWFAGRRGAARSLSERIVETSLDLILVVDRQGNFKQVSPSSFTVLGYRPNEMLGRNAVPFLYPDDLDHTRQEMRMARRTGVMRNFECRYVHKQGYVVPLAWTGVWAETEQRHFFIGRDMTERHRVEAEIRRLNEALEDRVRQRTAELTAANEELAAIHATEERFRMMVETVRDYAIYTLDPKGNITSWNTGAMRLTGYSADDVIGRNFSVFYTEEDRRQEHPDQELNIAAIAGRYQEEGWRVRKNGSRFWASVTLTAVHSEGGVLLGFSKITHDMTQKRMTDAAIRQLNRQLEQRVAELAAANGELEAFSYSISHDLRAPLRAIDGFSRILMEDHLGQLSEDGRHVVEVVRRNTQQMGRLIDDLLAFSRLGRQALKTEPVALADLAHDVMADLQGETAGRQLEVAIGELGLADADPALLKQVFVNLLSNALKFTRKRERATIAVDIARDPPAPVAAEAGGATVYFVRDNGAGFDMRYADKLFSVFHRLHRAEDYEGTGVGLAIVQRVIQRHGGHIWADGKPDEGATFYFTLRGG
jgi:PAS domain S-box-containing protein